MRGQEVWSGGVGDSGEYDLSNRLGKVDGVLGNGLKLSLKDVELAMEVVEFAELGVEMNPLLNSLGVGEDVTFVETSLQGAGVQEIGHIVR